ncbi:DMT family transporter [Actinobacillus equuli]|uniref:DMT family transporter n=1 Tax=Actinobacillus equuli TaxID=718 RepID=UPI002442D99D|nr:DMT family transporter [Actinobacillus equuli]WGE57050.1 DMT family transporter [Actinobacillus equuli subsp. equuli]
MNETFKGILQGLLSGMLWGLDTSLNAFILTLTPFIILDPQLLPSALLLAFLHDFFSAILLTGSSIFNRDKWKFSTIFTSKSTYFVMIAALFAGPIGMRAYLYAVDSIGAGLSATISALYPALAAVLGVVFLKDYLPKRGWLGLSLVILATVILGYSHFSVSSGLLFGILSAFVCVVGWASESVITAYGMKDDLTPKQALLIRQWTSSIAYLGFMFVEGDVSYSLSVVLSSQTSFIIILLAMIGTFSYLCYYSAINKIGPVKATGMNVTYSIWTVIFSLFIFGGNLDIKLVICGIFIIIGTLFVIKN